MTNVPDSPLQIIKIGGSIVTVKEGEYLFHDDRTRSLGHALASYPGPLIIVHGTGSYGKPPARQFGYMDGALPSNRKDIVARVESLLRVLRSKVIDTFLDCSLPAYGVHVRELFYSRGREVRLRQTSPLTDLLDRGLVPVICGGFVINQKDGFQVYSSDYIATELAKALQAKTLIFATDMPGVYSPDDPTHFLEEFSGQDLKSIEAANGDISNGMWGKLNAAIGAANAGIRTIIADGADPSNLLNILNDRDWKGTRIAADSMPGNQNQFRIHDYYRERHIGF